ncbi:MULTISPECIES: DUF6617 family protein [Aequorivita]|uniref:DUF6617 family protein n=2 Tax=Aequorivita TaxID=153265 RepID=A0AB35YUL7_9FLAO|nr:DUF6617 family protein [Aequorivita sp. Ant34-E75]WGF92132.1 hypothetical protein QCQ61_13085 [Aequorivita sp. Ant34-E75]
MSGNIFSSLVSITRGIHRDNKTEHEYTLLLTHIDKVSLASNAAFEIKFKRPLNSKKEYYQQVIRNETEKIIQSFLEEFPSNAIMEENKFAYGIFENKFTKYLQDIAYYIENRQIDDDLRTDDNYIIHYLKISALRLYAELQEQYGQYSTNPAYTIPELAEKYFNDPDFGTDSICKKEKKSVLTVEKGSSKTIRNTKTSFNFTKTDTSILLKVLQQLQLKIDLLKIETNVEQLYQLLISSDYNQLDYKIYLECETTQFSYIVSQLNPFFTNLKPASIERSNKFITLTGVPLKANNLYKNKVHNTKEKEEIDKIIQQLQ